MSNNKDRIKFLQESLSNAEKENDILKILNSLHPPHITHEELLGYAVSFQANQ